jgi:transketolase
MQKGERIMKLESGVHSKNILQWAKDHPEAVVLSGDLGTSCDIKEFKKLYPERYFIFGLAEQNMVGWAAGLAREGYRPFLHTFGVFMYRRALDQIEMSVAYPNLPVTFVGFLPGIMTPGGVSHQSINDVAVLRGIPNMTILDTGDATDVESVLDVAEKVNGPVYIRMIRGEIPRLFEASDRMILNKARVISEGMDVAVLSSNVCTEEAMRATSVLRDRGLSIQHLHITTLKPFNDPLVVDTLKKVKYGAVTLENHTIIGGLGTAAAELMAEHGIGKPLVKTGIRDTYTHGASKMYLMKKYGLDAMSLVASVEKLVGKSFNINEDDLEKVRFVDYTAV